MRKFILTFALLVGGFAISNASIITENNVKLTVGSNPVSILEDPEDGTINIFCAGIDANNNNVFDEGQDEKPSWWKYNPNGSSTEANMVKEFDNFFVSPFKPSILTSGGTSFGIPFKCSVDGGNFVGSTKFDVYQSQSLGLIFSKEIPQSEVLHSEYFQDRAITITRVDGNDMITYTDLLTNKNTNYNLDGDASDFTFVDLDGDGVMELAVLVENKKMEFYGIKDEIKLIGDYDLSQLDTYTGAFGHLYSHGKYVYTTIKDSKVTIELTPDMDGNIEITHSSYSIDYLGNLNSYYKINDDNAILTNTNYNLVVDATISIPELHRTSTPTDFVYANQNQLYVTGDKTVFIYDIKNELNKDVSQKSFGYFGYQPMDILSFDNNFYSINLGIDFNFDGKIDETVGDQKPSINKFDLDNSNYIFANNQKQMDIDFPINFPLNTNISSDGDIILPSGNMAYYYNVNDNKVYDSLDAEMYVSCAFRVLDYLVLGERDMATNKSYVRIKKGDFIDVKEEVGTNVIDLIVYQNASGFGVVSLSEGNFGQADSKINILKLTIMGFGDNIEKVVGTGGSNIVTNADQTKAAIVMNGSHEIHILDLLTDEIIKTFPTGTTGYGGPRDAKFLGDMLYVTTYSNQVLVFNSITGEKVSSVLVDGLTEGLLLTDKYLLTTNIDYSNYKPSNRIFAYNLDKISDVKVATPSQQVIRVYPNPVVNDFHLVSDDLAGKNDIAIINSAGKIVATHNGSSNGAIALNADALGLTAGNYTAVINGTRAVRFVVIK